MDTLQGMLAQLPTAGVYVVGAAVVALLGGSGVGAAGALAPGKNPFNPACQLMNFRAPTRFGSLVNP